jgi:hypothetical protein
MLERYSGVLKRLNRGRFQMCFSHISAAIKETPGRTRVRSSDRAEALIEPGASIPS